MMSAVSGFFTSRESVQGIVPVPMGTLQAYSSCREIPSGAHIKECFYKYSLNFVEGSGQIDGEIMETLWSIMNKVSGITRSMSWAHRQEMLDDYMEDGNFKKLVRSGE